MRKFRSYLYQGDISDLNVLPHPLADMTGLTVAQKYKITLAINVGSTPFVPRNFPTVYLPMLDSTRAEDNDWRRVIRVIRLAMDEVRHGGIVLVTCDAGLSRSAVFSAMLIGAIEQRPMDDKLLDEFRAAGCDPLPELWKAANKLMTWCWL